MRHSLCLLAVLVAASSCVAAAPPQVSSPSPTATEIIGRMLTAISDRRQPFRRTYEIHGQTLYRDSSGALRQSREDLRQMQLFDPPNKLDQTSIDLSSPDRGEVRTITVGAVVYTMGINGWMCAPTSPAYQITPDALIFDRLLRELQAAGRVTGRASCAGGRCYQLAVEFSDASAGPPSTVGLVVSIDERTFLPLAYTATRTYEDGTSTVRSTATFEYNVSDHVSDPIPSCDRASG